MFFVPWLLLFLLLCLERNRRDRAWPVLAPFLLIHAVLLACWALAGSFEAPPSFTGGSFHIGDTVSVFAFGMAVLWALSYTLQGRPHAAAFRRALRVLGLAILAGGFCVGGLSLSMSSIATFLSLVAGLVVSLALVLAGVVCREKYTPRRFTLSFLAFCLASSVFSGPVLGAVLCMSSAPFVLLCFATQCYRERFYSIFRLPSMATAPGEFPEDAHGAEEGYDAPV